MRSVIINGVAIGLTLTAAGKGELALAAILAVVWAVWAFGSRLTRSTSHGRFVGHSHPGPVARVAVHEGGHLSAIKLVGGRITGAHVSGTGNSANGYAEGIIPDDPVSRVAVSMAGLLAAPDTYSPSDDRHVQQILRDVPRPYRGMVRNEAKKLAHKAARSSDVQYYARKLERHGRL